MMTPHQLTPSQLSAFWSLPTTQVLQTLHASAAGLSRQQAQQRLTEYGANSLKQKRKASALLLLLNQFKSPIIVILIMAAVLSIFLQDAASAVIILTIVFISGLLVFWPGKVQTSWFSDKVGISLTWRLLLNPEGKIFFVGIALLSSPKELLNLGLVR